jgi:hypothetical protein
MAGSEVGSLLPLEGLEALSNEQARWIEQHHERFDGTGYPQVWPARKSPRAPDCSRLQTAGTQ